MPVFTDIYLANKQLLLTSLFPNIAGILAGGFSYENADGRVCLCLPGTSGASCEFIDSPDQGGNGTDACQPNPCSNDGFCDIDAETGSFLCTCRNGWLCRSLFPWFIGLVFTLLIYCFVQF